MFNGSHFRVWMKDIFLVGGQLGALIARTPLFSFDKGPVTVKEQALTGKFINQAEVVGRVKFSEGQREFDIPVSAGFWLLQVRGKTGQDALREHFGPQEGKHQALKVCLPFDSMGSNSL